MSHMDAKTPKCTGDTGPLDLVIKARERDLGGFNVRRMLPARERRMIGPFIFFDHLGPAAFPPGKGIQVRPHPHIGLATITYLFEGEMIHRDSLGFVQPIQAGAVNLMTAGQGIVHSERAGDDLNTASRLHGIQSWMALPANDEERHAAFAHYPATVIPELDRKGVTVRVIIGEAYGHTSPVKSYSPMVYLECRLLEGTVLTLPDSYRELAAYVVAGAVRIDRQTYPAGVMVVACPNQTLNLRARTNSHVLVIGGDPVGQRHIWWNFVSSSRERIEQAKAAWKQGRFRQVPGETEFIPLPDE